MLYGYYLLDMEFWLQTISAKRIACCALLAATVITVPGMASAQSFFKLDNKGDLNFNQLLGINGHLEK